MQQAILHDGPTAKAKSTHLAGYANLDLLAYPSGDRAARWLAAKAAAKSVLDAAQGYKFNLAAPVSATKGKPIMSLLPWVAKAPLVTRPQPVELIFQRTSSHSTHRKITGP
jgi:hypothetical protein